MQFNNYISVKACGLLLAGLLFSLAPANSQNQQTTTPKVWTLQQCLDYAMDNSIQIKTAELNAEQNRANYSQSKGKLYPSLNGSASHNYNFGRSIDPFTNQFVEQRIRSNNFSINGSIPLFNGLQNITSIKMDKINYQASRADIEKAKNDTRLSIAANYLQVILNKELLEVAKIQAATTAEQAKRTEKLVNAGALPMANLLEIKGQLASDELAVINAENQLIISKVNLQQFLLLPVNNDFEIESPQVADPGEANLDLINSNEIYSTALTTQPQIESADMRVKSSLLGVRAARGGYLPRLSLNGNVFTGYSSARQKVIIEGGIEPEFIYFTDNKGISRPLPKSLFEANAGPTQRTAEYPFGEQLRDNISQSVGLSLVIPILNGFQARSNVANSIVNAKRAQLTAQDTRNQLRQTIEQAYADAKAAQKRYVATQNQLEALREAFRATEQRFNVGALNALDYNVAKNNLTNAESNFLQAKYDFIFKTKVLDFYQGKPLTL